MNDTHYYDQEASSLHDRTVYDILRRLPPDVHPAVVQSLLEGLDDHDLEAIRSCTDWDLVLYKADRIASRRRSRSKSVHVTRRPNYPIAQVLDDYLTRRTGRFREAHRQLRARFPGLDHDMQEAVMMALMSRGTYSDRALVYKYLYEDDEFWEETYVPLVKAWWEQFHDPKMGKVVVKRCPREYVRAHYSELLGCCNYASLCLKAGVSPEEGKLPHRTYLYVKKCVGDRLRPREGEEIVLRWVREYLYEDEQKTVYDSIFSIPYVGRMVSYLGEMGCLDDILSLEAFDARMQDLPRIEWGTDIIQAIEEEFPMDEYVFKEVK